MGARFYNRATGAFTATDPVPGGNLTAYSYPIDPINMYDLDGHKGRLKKAARWVGEQWKNGNVVKFASVVALGACVLASAGICGAAAIGAAAVSVGYNGYKKATLGSKYSWTQFLWDSTQDVLYAGIPGARAAKFSTGFHRAAGKARVSSRPVVRSHVGPRRSLGQHVRRYGQGFLNAVDQRGVAWYSATVSAQGLGTYRAFRG